MEVAALSGIARTQNADTDEGGEPQMSNFKTDNPGNFVALGRRGGEKLSSARVAEVGGLSGSAK